jgi:hypothetical protein
MKPLSPSLRFTLARLLGAGVALAGAVSACTSSESGSVAQSTCGAGDAVTAEGESWCVYESGLIIEGFICPESLPFPFDGPGGTKVCGGKSGVPQEIVEKVVNAWQGEGSDGTDGSLPVDDVVTPEPDAVIPDPDVDGPEPQQTLVIPGLGLETDWCAQMTDDVKIGDSYIVIDWQCPVASICGEGLVAACGDESNPDYYCRCVDGYQQCVEIGSAGTDSCPVKGQAAGGKCLDALGADACESGAWCDVAEGQVFGTCKALTAPCGEPRACYADDVCDDGMRCYGADPLKNVLGTCRELPTLPACVHDRDCPFDFTCEGETLGCEDACGCDDPAALDTPGTCIKKAGFSDLNIWVDMDDKKSGDVVVPYWNKGAIGDNSDWISCPSYEVQVQDAEVGWKTVAKELCEDEGILIEVKPGDILARPGFAVTLAAPGETGYFRLRGTYYNGCEGKTGPSQCEGGPYERFTPATYKVK